MLEFIGAAIWGCDDGMLSIAEKLLKFPKHLRLRSGPDSGGKQRVAGWQKTGYRRSEQVIMTISLLLITCMIKILHLHFLITC